MFELIAALFRVLFPKDESDAPRDKVARSGSEEEDLLSGRSVAASEETVQKVTVECVNDLYHKTLDDTDPHHQMLYAFMLGVRISLTDVGLGRAIQEAMLLPAFKGGRGTAMMDQAAAELREMIESHQPKETI